MMSSPHSCHAAKAGQRRNRHASCRSPRLHKRRLSRLLFRAAGEPAGVPHKAKPRSRREREAPIVWNWCPRRPSARAQRVCDGCDRSSLRGGVAQRGCKPVVAAGACNGATRPLLHSPGVHVAPHGAVGSVPGTARGGWERARLWVHRGRGQWRPPTAMRLALC